MDGKRRSSRQFVHLSLSSFVCWKISGKQTLNAIAYETVHCWPTNTQTHTLAHTFSFEQQNVKRICDNRTTHVNKHFSKYSIGELITTSHSPMMNSFPLTIFDVHTHTTKQNKWFLVRSRLTAEQMFCGRFTANENNNQNRRFIYNAQWNRKQSFYTHTQKTVSSCQ